MIESGWLSAFWGCTSVDDIMHPPQTVRHCETAPVFQRPTLSLTRQQHTTTASCQNALSHSGPRQNHPSYLKLERLGPISSPSVNEISHRKDHRPSLAFLGLRLQTSGHCEVGLPTRPKGSPPPQRVKIGRPQKWILVSLS